MLLQNAAIITSPTASRRPALAVTAVRASAPKPPAGWPSSIPTCTRPSPLFAPGKFIADESQYDAIRAAAHKRLRSLFETADRQLADKPWLAGFRSFADPYFYITLRWAAGTKVDLSGLDNLAAWHAWTPMPACRPR